MYWFIVVYYFKFFIASIMINSRRSHFIDASSELITIYKILDAHEILK